MTRDQYINLLDRLDAIETTIKGKHIELIDQDELCKRLRISKPTARRWERRGKIIAIRFGDNILYNWPKVVANLEKKSATVK